MKCTWGEFRMRRRCMRWRWCCLWSACRRRLSVGGISGNPLRWGLRGRWRMIGGSRWWRRWGFCWCRSLGSLCIKMRRRFWGGSGMGGWVGRRMSCERTGGISKPHLQPPTTSTWSGNTSSATTWATEPTVKTFAGGTSTDQTPLKTPPTPSNPTKSSQTSSEKAKWSKPFAQFGQYTPPQLRCNSTCPLKSSENQLSTSSSRSRSTLKWTKSSKRTGAACPEKTSRPSSSRSMMSIKQRIKGIKEDQSLFQIIQDSSNSQRNLTLIRFGRI